MKKAFTFCLLLIVLICTKTSAQETFKKKFATTLSSIFFAAAEISDNNQTLMCGWGNGKIYCVKVNEDGTEVFSKAYISDLSESNPRCTFTPDGGFVLASLSRNNMYVPVGFLFIKCNATGNIEWAKRLSSSPLNAASLKAISSDSLGNIAAGFDVGSIDNSLEIISLNSVGNINWAVSCTPEWESLYGISYYGNTILAKGNRVFFAGGSDCQACNYGSEKGFILMVKNNGTTGEFKKFALVKSSSYFDEHVDAAYQLIFPGNTLYVFGYHDGYNSIFRVPVSNTTTHVNLISANTFSVQHYLRRFKTAIPYFPNFYNDGSFASFDARSFYLQKYDAQGRICPDYTIPVFDSTILDTTFTIWDWPFTIENDAIAQVGVTIKDSAITGETLICSGSALVARSITATFQQAKSANIRLFPNPAKNFITIQYESSKNQKAQIDIISADGRLLKSIEINFITGLNSMTINTGTLNNGLYFLRITTATEQFKTNFIKTSQ